MLFTSFEFVAFLACVLGLYYLIPVRFQWVLLLVANVFFYARSGLYGLLFMGVTIVTSYAAARIMSAVQYHMDDTVKAHKEVWSKQERKACNSGAATATPKNEPHKKPPVGPAKMPKPPRIPENTGNPTAPKIR